MMSPRISVIMPIYNMANSLSRAIESILAQTYTDFELLLVDDGSKDESGKICDYYASQYPNVYSFHKPNGGLSSTRNLGMEHAKGEWITFCDADDFATSEWLGNFKLEENADKTVICQGLIKFKQNDKVLGGIEKVKEHRGFSDGDLRHVLSTLFLNGMLGWTHIKAYRLKDIRSRNIKFDIKHKYREDEKFLLEFLRPEDKLVLYNSVGYYYQVSDENKYNDWQCTPDFSKCIYDNVRRLGFESGSEFRTYFAEEYKTTLFKYFLIEKKDRKELFHNIQKLVKDEYHTIRIFPFSKFMIRYDKIGILSKSILTLHLNLKKK